MKIDYNYFGNYIFGHLIMTWIYSILSCTYTPVIIILTQPYESRKFSNFWDRVYGTSDR